MLLSSTVRDGIMYGALGLPVLGMLWIWRRRRAARWEIPDTLPPARVGSGRDTRKLLRHAAPAVLIAVGLAASLWAHGFSIAVVRVTDSSGAAGTAETGLARDVDRPIAAGAKAELKNSFFDGEWLVNDSSHAVRVETVDYGYALDTPPLVFPPGTSGIFYRIDYIGPKHRPPSAVMGSFGSATRYWLTWD